MFLGKNLKAGEDRIGWNENALPSPLASVVILTLAAVLAAMVAALPVRAKNTLPEVAIGQSHLSMAAGECDFEDPFEPNNGPGEAGPFPFNASPQTLSFHTQADEDWFLFSAFAGAKYTITAANLSSGTDTILFLFQPPSFGENDAIAWNDDFGGTLGSQIVWTAPKNGLYFFKVRDFNWRGDCHTYDLTLQAEFSQYWPRFDLHPTPTPTATATLTPSPTPTITPTLLPKPTHTSTATPTPIPAPAPSLVLGAGLVSPNDVAINPQTQRLYVTSRDTGQVIAVDAANNQIIASISVCQKPFGIDVNSQTNKVYVACFVDGRVAVIDGNTNVVTSALYAGPQPTYVDVNESTNRIYVVTHGDGRLVEIDGGNDTRTRSVESGQGAFGLAVNEGLNRVYVTNRDVQTVSTIDANTMAKIETQTVRPDANMPVPFGIAFNPSTSRLYVTYEKRGQLIKVAVYQVNAGGLARIATLTVPDGGDDAPGVLGVNPTTNHIFIPNSTSNSVTVIDGVSNSILYHIPLGLSPFGVDVDPVTNKVYEVTKNSHQVWMIPDW